MTEPECGVVLQGVDAPGEFCRRVEDIESLGFGYLWLTDSSLHARNCYSYLTLAAAHSTRLRLGPAVTNPVTRHPAITAAAAATVDEISGGRLILGIGAGDRPLLALGFQPSPLVTLEAAITGIRRLWRGEELDLQAPGFTMNGAHLRFPARTGIEVFVSASGPKTLELAGRIADGVILLVGLFPEALGWAISRVEQGARAADRPRPHIAVFAYGAIDEDEQAALEAARSIAAWFPQTAPPARGRADRRCPQRGSRFGARLPPGGRADEDGQGVRRGLAGPGRPGGEPWENQLGPGGSSACTMWPSRTGGTARLMCSPACLACRVCMKRPQPGSSSV